MGKLLGMLATVVMIAAALLVAYGLGGWLSGNGQVATTGIYGGASVYCLGILCIGIPAAIIIKILK